MNGNIKFHKATGPAFNPGELWVAASGRKVRIVSVRKYEGATDDHCSNFGVTYEWEERGRTVQHEKDAWNFQVRINPMRRYAQLFRNSNQMLATRYTDFNEWIIATAEAADLPVEAVKRVIGRIIDGDPVEYIEYGEGYWDFTAGAGAIYTQ